ncbi:MAG TPA: diaminopimelate decarboxylase [Solirubrobacteraceae bacterium]|nr:diaminopimelate decarboxylase [Solirubrobacteraceae bacterium]
MTVEASLQEHESILPRSAGRDRDGRLTIAGCALADVVAAAGTPALIVDEHELRATAREYVAAFRQRWPNSVVYFASKALSCSAVIRVFAEEGLGCDVASAGELAIALAGGMPAQRILLHGNAKRDVDLVAALDAGVGLIVIDSLDELGRLERLTTRPQRLLLRVNPAVAASTHEAMATGHEDSKFGLPPQQLREAVERVQHAPLLKLGGVHAHIGSQILELEPFERCVRALGTLGEVVRGGTFDLGGGLGVRYLPDEDEPPSIDEYAERLTAVARLAMPADARIIVEPGRSLVARAMITAYRVVSVKRAGRTFVSVDGGMADNLEPMMYGTPFAPFVLDAERPPEHCDVVGPHCETGDRLVQDAALASPRVDDLVVVPVTGAYCYALANNYNGACRPPIVLCRDGRARVVQRRETIEDLLARNCDLALEC